MQPVSAKEVPVRSKKSNYPEPFASMMNGRIKRKLGDVFDLKNFGVNLTELAPGSMSALKHQHSRQDEFVYILSGTPTVVYGNREYEMSPGQCMGFRASEASAHHLVNRSEQPATYLEIGDRTPGDKPVYPDDDISAKYGADGTWTFTHKDGTAY